MSRTDEREEVKRVRVPMGGRRTKLQVSDEDSKRMKDSGYVMRWINNKDGRIQQALAGGYEHVAASEVPSFGIVTAAGNKSLTKKVSTIVSKGEKNPTEAFLMKIKREYYDEDQLTKQRANDAFDQALKDGQPGGNVVENQYVPKGHTQQV